VQKKIQILLIAQVAPLIHGQAIMAAQLASMMAKWPSAELHVINTCYARERGNLGGFSVLKVLRWIRYLCQMLWCICRGRADVILMTHSFFRGPFVKDSAFLWLAHLLKKKIIVWVHMDPQRLELATVSPWFLSYVRKVLRLPDRWVACAPSLIEQWPQEFDRDKVVALCNSIADPQPRAKLPVGAEYHIVFLSAMTAEKGWQELFSVAEIICAERADVWFDFYGGPGAQESAEQLRIKFAQSNNAARIRWHGELWGGKKQAVLSQADLFCLPSWTEAFPLAILEAMAYALPVIATRVGGIPDAITHDENGWLYPARDSKALLATLRHALQHQSTWREIGNRNRQRFLQKFSLEVFEKRWKECLTDTW